MSSNDLISGVAQPQRRAIWQTQQSLHMAEHRRGYEHSDIRLGVDIPGLVLVWKIPRLGTMRENMSLAKIGGVEATCRIRPRFFDG